MAVTIHQTPAAYSPSDNPLRYSFSSNQTAQANFSFIVRTFMNGILVSTDRVFPDNGVRAFFDASKVARYNLDSVIFRNNVSANAGTMKSIYITVTESYGTPPVENASATSATTQTWKACLSDAEFVSTNFANDWVDSKFLTNAPRGEDILILPTQDTALMMLNTATSSTLTIEAYNATGTLIGSNTSSYLTLIRQFNLKRSLVAAFTSAAEQDIAYITIRVDLSETLVFRYYNDTCSDPTSLLWVNEYGAIDSFIFEHNIKQSGDISSFGYQRKFGGWNGTSYDYSATSHQALNYTSIQEDKAIIYTNYINQSQQNYLTENYKSPVHWIDRGNGIIPIKITSRSFEKYQDRFEELYSEEIAFTYSLMHKGITL